ncbi:MAG: HlyD family efflux transporter periplasmic adaptor subunit [Planctomycetota bacterium]|nr:HlyD family efflux transporter periplasmic adaptor subunit [Planctomycetota bacterium]
MRTSVMRWIFGLTLMILMGQVAFTQPPREETAGVFVIADCNVSLVEEVEVAAQLPGLLTAMGVREGASVKKNDLLAQIDDADARVRREEVELQLKVSKKEASNDINVKAAIASADVADAELKESQAVNTESPGAVPQTQIRREMLTVERARLQVDVARLELEVAGLTSDVRQAQLNRADLDVDRRKVNSPLDGEVERRYKDVGEWVQVGDPIFQVVRMDRLRIEGFVTIQQQLPQLLMGRPVTVTYTIVDPTGGQPEKKVFTFSGKIQFVSNKVEAGGEYKVWAEVENQQYKGQWILRPGVTLDMSVGVVPANRD